MEHGTTLLLGLAGVAVQRVELDDAGARVVQVRTADETGSACPSCGVFSTAVKGNVTTRPKDLPLWAGTGGAALAQAPLALSGGGVCS